MEAELVSETPSSEDAFEDDAPSDSPPPDAVQGDAGDAAAGNANADGGDGPGNGADRPDGKRKSTLTPGVMLFLAFVVVALIAFSVWWFQMRPGDEASAENERADIQETEPGASVPDNAPDISDEPDDASVDDAGPAAKIGNLPDDDLKPDNRPAQGGGALPPVSEEGAAKIANSTEDGAKDALRRDNEAGETEQDQPTDQLPQTPEESAAEVGQESESATPQAAASSPEASPPNENETATEMPEEAPGEAEAQPAGEETSTQTAQSTEESAPNETGGEDAAVALQAEMESMRAAFEEERAELAAALDRARADNEAQAEELSRLRDQLENRDSAADDEIQRLRAELATNERAADEEIARLRSELQQLRNDRAQQSARQMKASFALAALSRAVEQGDPYAEELAAIEDFEPGAGAALEAHADTGVATNAALRISFDAAARKALAAAGQAEAGDGISGLMARAKNIISVRPARPLEGDDPGAILSRAEHALEQGETGFALLQLEDLPLPAQEAMADWIAQARARAEANAAVAALTSRFAGETE
ncbi:MAG: hypothetical protein CMI63_02730 [Parvularcula sp.]|nr:hypothetical protein [Parvularcula sp.]